MQRRQGEMGLGSHFGTLRDGTTLRDSTMKKILLVGALALLALFSAQQQASAWLNFKFGAGINWAWQSGGNNTLWGLFRNGQPPGFGPQYDPSCLPSNQ